MASLEPWQVEAMTLLRESLGVNDGAILRAGVTLVLMMVGAAPGIIAQAMSDGSVSAQVIDVECGAVAKAGEED